MAVLLEMVIAGEQKPLFCGCQAHKFGIRDRFLKRGIESQDPKVFSQLAEVIVAYEKHRGNLSYSIGRSKVIEKGDGQFLLDYGPYLLIIIFCLRKGGGVAQW